MTSIDFAAISPSDSWATNALSTPLAAAMHLQSFHRMVCAGLSIPEALGQLRGCGVETYGAALVRLGAVELGSIDEQTFQTLTVKLIEHTFQAHRSTSIARALTSHGISPETATRLASQVISGQIRCWPFESLVARAADLELQLV